MSKKIYINPGHSDVDPGAIGYAVERELNVKVSKYMKSYLTSNYVCETKMNPGTVNRLAIACDEANKWGADLFVSNHFNAGGGDGYEALVYSSDRDDLGKIFEKYVKSIGQNSRGVRYRPDLGVLRLTNMPAVLNEGAFVDNYNDIKDWNDDSELKKLGEAYAKAAAEYLNLTKKQKVVSKSFKVKVNVDSLNIRSGAGSKFSITGRIKDKGIYTIVDTSGNWGKLKSGAGWIYLKYTQKL